MITKRQEKILELLEELAVKGQIKLSNGTLSVELAKKKKLTGFDGEPMKKEGISRHLSILEKENEIWIERPENNADRVIHLGAKPKPKKKGKGANE